ncbi:MAG TPA: biosynthetic peptidoglycan transglycosylase [Longimicrobiaceae bacterium]
MEDRVPLTAGRGWLHLGRSLREAGRLARVNPGLTGFMRHRASQAGPKPEPDTGSWVALEDISPYLVCAVVRSEDRGFFRHRGFWWSNMWVEIKLARKEKRGVRGVSTITQQLARNLYLHPERSMTRKLHEAIVAQRLESALTKRRILELYLNLIEWGDGIWGVEAAARRYFGRTPAEIDPVQAVMLASLIPAPRRPLVDRNAKRAVSTQNRLMFHLYGCGIVSSDEWGQAVDRVVYVGQSIDEGIPALEMFRRPELAIEPTLQDRPEISTGALLADDCGMDRCNRLMALVQASGRQIISRLPLWWTGDPDQVAPEGESAPAAVPA